MEEKEQDLFDNSSINISSTNQWKGPDGHDRLEVPRIGIGNLDFPTNTKSINQIVL